MGIVITVLSGGALEPGLDFVGQAFQKETGHAVKITFNSGAEGRKRMDDGEIFDVVVGSSHTISANFLPAGRVEQGGLKIGRVGLGVMTRHGAPSPDISSTASLRQALLDAKAVLYTEETSGRCIEAMLQKMGIHEQLEAKTTRFRNGPELMDRVLAGTGNEISFLPITAIRTYADRGIVFVGPLPEEVQHYLEFIAVPSTKSTNKGIAWDFVRFCEGPGRPLLAANGLN